MSLKIKCFTRNSFAAYVQVDCKMRKPLVCKKSYSYS